MKGQGLSCEAATSNRPISDSSLMEKMRRTITWYRVPSATSAIVVLVLFMHQRQAFWYGVPLVLVGELLQLWASSQIHKNTRFTVSGPYAYVRNPMYIGRFFLLLGFFGMTWNAILIILYVLLFAAYAQTRVRREEKRLQQIFAPHYQYYCSEIHRWMLRLEPYSQATPQRASWAQPVLIMSILF